MPANASFDKGRAVEEWTDLRFFRPAGLRIARALMPTRLSPDHVTMLALVVGLVAGRLCYYDSVGLNALGVVLFIVSDIFDSADGQLARMRGTSSRLGKVLDGIADGARFTISYQGNGGKDVVLTQVIAPTQLVVTKARTGSTLRISR